VRTVALALVLLALIAVCAPQVTRAQKPDRNRIVRSDGAVFAIQRSDRTFSPSFAGVVTEQARVNQKLDTKNKFPASPQSTESIIGPDNRTQILDTTVYPNSAIAQLQMTFPGGALQCTGWFIDANRLATTAHCVYVAGYGGFFTSANVIPGRNGGSAPFGSYAAIYGTVPSRWVDTQNPKYDYAVIELAEDAGDTVGWFGYGWNSDNTFFDGRKVSVRGYPGDKPYGTLWTEAGKIKVVKRTRFFYDIDTTAGESGAPLYGKWGTCKPCSFGIHNYGVDTVWTRNSATRITRKVFHFLDTRSAP
jgi:glutamyl endopeptidase